MKKQITVIGFGRITDIIGKNAVVLDAFEDTEAVLSHLEKTYPALKTIKYALAVDKQLVTSNRVLHDGATIALLPPFSGG